ncbi:MAG: hypothetical protein JEZ11_25755 [Desulfobacterales bacterium]|nr:hypothetical protein [Desulfobacterales bacterium]
MDASYASPLLKIMAAREKKLAVDALMTAGGPLLGLFTLFGRGVALDVSTGCSIQDLVCEQMGIAPDYLATGIQTIFLDGWAVDGIDTATVASGSVLALSAAMPGLVGATMRRGGHYAKLRGNITYSGTADACTAGETGTVLVKLFNQVAKDLGGLFLERGVWVEGDRFADFIGAQSPGAIATLTLDGSAATAEEILRTDWHDRAVFLSMGK